MRRITVSIVLAALCLAVAIWCYLNFERVTKREFVNYSGEAARNPLLALQRLVERMGVKVVVARKPPDLDAAPAGATVVLARNRQGMNRTRVSGLVRSIAAGGHLIVEAERADQRDPLLDALRVSRREVSSGKSLQTVQIRLPGAVNTLQAALPLMELRDDDGRNAYSVRGETGTALLDFRQGRGRVTVLPSFAFMRNAQIGEPDHAALAWGLVALAPDTAAVVIAPPFERPSITEWLFREARAPLAAAAALLALWLWRVGSRFGPQLPTPDARRRRLLDHLRASGRFLWASGSGPRLLAAAREACLAKIARNRPALAELPRTVRSERFAELAQLAPGDVEHALNGEASTQRAFTAAVRTLQQIEEKLTRPVSR